MIKIPRSNNEYAEENVKRHEKVDYSKYGVEY